MAWSRSTAVLAAAAAAGAGLVAVLVGRRWFGREIGRAHV